MVWQSEDIKWIFHLKSNYDNVLLQFSFLVSHYITIIHMSWELSCLDICKRIIFCHHNLKYLLKSVSEICPYSDNYYITPPQGNYSATHFTEIINLRRYFFGFNSISAHPVDTKFCSCHNSCAVVTCAKFGSNCFIKFDIKNWFFSSIFISNHDFEWKRLVLWSLGWVTGCWTVWTKRNEFSILLI